MRQEQINEMLRDFKRIGANIEPDMADHCLKVPLDFYRSENYAQREREILVSTPLMMAHCDQLKNPYDYLVREMIGKSILLTRDGEGEVHAFLNACRHRGHEPASGCGNKRRFSCPYHSWTYDIKGQLIAMPLKERYEGVDFGELGLTELPCEERHGFIWAILTPGLPIDVREHLGPIDEEMEGWGYEDARCLDLREDVLECNWKSTGEGFLETLHLPTIHPASFSSMVSKHIDLVYSQQRDKHICAVVLAKPPEDYVAIEDTDSVIDISKPGWQMQFCTYGNLSYWIYPNTFLGNHSVYGGMSFTSYQPGPTPNTTIVRIHYLMRREIADDPQNAEILEAMKPLVVNAIINEDGPALSSCGRGIRSGVEDITIGRNELAVQMMIGQLAEDLDCPLTTL